jgi:CDP-diacylglycerol--glycerol-3-phosphate 3-phosphatidyltransferase
MLTNWLIAFPLSLTTLRLLLGPLAIGMALNNSTRSLFAPLILAGMLSDYFDGVLARRFGVAYPGLRRFDSLTDILFYVCILITSFIVAGDVLRQSAVPLVLTILSELACILLSVLRFRVFPATHCYSAKFYGLMLCVVFISVLSFNGGAWMFYVLSAVGLAANAEVIAILLLSQSAPVDVRTVFDLRRKSSRAAQISFK